MYDRLTMPFGKYKHWLLRDVPSSYLCWCLEECDNLRPGLKAAIRAKLADRFGPRPGGAPAGRDVREVAAGVEAIYRQLTMTWHPDRGGTTEAMQALNQFRERLQGLVA
jgi:hypothetical protein